MQKDQSSVKNKGDQDSSSTEQKSPNNVKKDEEDLIKTTENFTPYPLSRLSTLTSAIQETAKEVLSTSTEMSTTPKNFTLIEVEILSTTVSPLATIPSEPDQDEATTIQTMPEEEVSTESSTKIIPTETSVVTESTTQSTTPLSHVSTSQEPEKVVSTTIRPPHRKLANLRRQDTFNCLEKEMYRFYGDNRDCRLFHYCSPGFTSRQVLDFRFVCEEGTTFDEESQSCKHDTRGKKCLNRQW
ncbi:hypothetical protein WN55_09850 [Dufourea novaeangliae]|uniref:Chitin-binding type-2 domain-containing protein n=2 Tax=Dufourea novaeangliae TaxID=178035 RepID=A0A154P909_DUFNO|nr:hypothetical protein WN55_09850 [Dufourea novaeangliae]